MPVAVIVGASSKHDQGGDCQELPASSRWGLGGALALRFAAGGFHVALLARRKEVLESIAAAVRDAGGEATALCCDVASDASVKEAFAAAAALGDVDVVVFNAAPPFPPGCSWPDFPAPEAVDPEYLQKAFDVGVTGCVRCAREVMPAMVQRGRGSFLISGATMALRGGARFGFMAPVKAALRSYGQSMYQHYAPLGVHVAHVIIDGVVHSPNTRAWGTTQDPMALADQYWHLHSQPQSVWSYELQVSPFDAGVGMRL